MPAHSSARRLSAAEYRELTRLLGEWDRDVDMRPVDWTFLATMVAKVELHRRQIEVTDHEFDRVRSLVDGQYGV